MNALVTGHKGFIGKNFIKKLDNSIGLDEGYDQKTLLKFLENNNPDVIFHVGACSDTLMKDVNYIMTVNYLATKWLTDWAVENGKKIIYSSSASVYGEDKTKPSNLYGWTKLLGEDYVINKGGIALRYFNVYGPGEEHKGKMASLVYQNKDNKIVKLFPGFPTRDFVYVDDVVKANLYAYQNYDKLKGKWYEVGSGEGNRFENIFHYMEIPFEYLSADMIPKGYQFETKSETDKWMPGWTPDFNLKDGIKEYKKYLGV